MQMKFTTTMIAEQNCVMVPPVSTGPCLHCKCVISLLNSVNPGGGGGGGGLGVVCKRGLLCGDRRKTFPLNLCSCTLSSAACGGVSCGSALGEG